MPVEVGAFKTSGGIVCYRRRVKSNIGDRDILINTRTDNLINIVIDMNGPSDERSVGATLTQQETLDVIDALTETLIELHKEQPNVQR